MILTFIVTIDPVKSIEYLNVMIHSLNIQTSRNFDVVFYNQTLNSENEIFSKLKTKPNFNYKLFSIDREMFLGNYPIWDLYGFHAFLIREDLVGDYFMSLHMEEFLVSDYVQEMSKVLERESLDILMGNLTRSNIKLNEILPLISMDSLDEYELFLNQKEIKDSFHWCFSSEQFFVRNKNKRKENILNFLGFGAKRKIRPSSKGYITMPWYYAEDVFFMKKSFARKFNWFLDGHQLYFEDIHICEIPNVCALGKELKKITTFPSYFNRSRVYHINHDRYYFQLLDKDFTNEMILFETDDPILLSLKESIQKLRNGEFTLSEALKYTRRNANKTGTQNLNYKYHLMYLNKK